MGDESEKKPKGEAPPAASNQPNQAPLIVNQPLQHTVIAGELTMSTIASTIGLSSGSGPPLPSQHHHHNKTILHLNDQSSPYKTNSNQVEQNSTNSTPSSSPRKKARKQLLEPLNDHQQVDHRTDQQMNHNVMIRGGGQPIPQGHLQIPAAHSQPPLNYNRPAALVPVGSMPIGLTASPPPHVGSLQPQQVAALPAHSQPLTHLGPYTAHSQAGRVSALGAPPGMSINLSQPLPAHLTSLTTSAVGVPAGIIISGAACPPVSSMPPGSTPGVVVGGGQQQPIELKVTPTNRQQQQAAASKTSSESKPKDLSISSTQNSTTSKPPPPSTPQHLSNGVTSSPRPSPAATPKAIAAAGPPPPTTTGRGRKGNNNTNATGAAAAGGDSSTAARNSPRKPRLVLPSLVASAGQPAKSLAYHFLRYNDLKHKDSKKQTLSDLSQEGLQKKNGWKIEHLVVSQIQDVLNIEHDVASRLSTLSGAMKTELGPELHRLNESAKRPETCFNPPEDAVEKLLDVLKGCQQRSHLFHEQVNDSKSLALRLAHDHKERVQAVTKKCANKRTYVKSN